MSQALKILIQKIGWISGYVTSLATNSRGKKKNLYWLSQSEQRKKKKADQAQCIPHDVRARSVVMIWGEAGACCASSYFLVDWRNVAVAVVPEAPPPLP